MGGKQGRRRWLIFGSAIAAIGGVAVITFLVFNPRLTRYVESAEFREEMEKATAKGLHFPASHFAPIRRTGLLAAASENFAATEGRKAMTTMDAHGIGARFNPLGIFLRRWQLDELKIDSGAVGIQIYEPKPEPTPAKPWYHVFLPDRVYLKRVTADPADVTWRMRGEKGGIFGTHLLITPHGRDFEYRATGGTLKNALVPDLPLRQTHMLITKELFTLYQLDLASGDGSIGAEGTVETRGEKRVDLKMKWDKLPLREWVPATWKSHVGGAVAGDLHWTGRDLKLETAKMRGTLQVHRGRVSGLKFLEQLAAVTKRAEFAQLDLSKCAAEIEWDQGQGQLKNVVLEDKGKFRVEGNVSFREQSLGGTIQLGLARAYLDWLPQPEEVFPRAEGDYLWATVHLSGTLEHPEQDLSPRLVDALKDSPGAFLGAALRAFGAWLRGGD